MRKILLIMAMVASLSVNAQSWNNDQNHYNGQNYGNNDRNHNDNDRNRNDYDRNYGYFNDYRDYNRRDGRWDPYSKEYIRPADKKEVKMIIKMLKGVSFDNQRTEMAKVCVTLRPVMAEDLYDMAKTFQFDNGRAEFLKYAMQYCVNPEKAYIFQDVFSFRNNADSFFRSIGYNVRSSWRQ